MDNQTQQTTSPKGDLVDITRELYEHNVELTIKNHTFLILQRMYAIINKRTGVRETAQELISSVIGELKFQVGSIVLIDGKTKMLKTAASAYADDLGKDTYKSIEKVRSFIIPLREKNNLFVDVAVKKHRRLTNMAIDIFSPLMDPESAKQMQDFFRVESFLLYPLIFSESSMGAIMFGLGKHVGALSRAEREALSELVDVITIAIQQSKMLYHIKQTNKHLKELDALKDEFVSIASHELRTPMTAIKSYLWMALNKSPEPLHETVKKYLEISYASTERLIRLVNDMLTVSRIERNKIEIKREVFDMLETCQRVHEELHVTAQEKNITFNLLHDGGEVFPIYGDKDKLREVVQNIVGNALKFTPPGGTITIHLYRNAKVHIAVTDTGSGIQKDDMSKLFKKFSKIDYSYTHHSSQPGTGLGLYISKQIVTLHDGTIEVESKVNEGSTFTIVLPLFHEKGGV